MSEKDNVAGPAEKLIFWLTAGLFVLAPFHAFLITWFRSLGLSGALNTVISSWREILLTLLLVLAVPRVKRVLFAKTERLFFIKENFFLLLFFFGAFLFLPFQNNFSQWLWGARYDLLPFFVFFLFQFLFFSKENSEKLIRIVFGVGFLIMLFGLIHALFLPQDFLAFFGYSVNRDIWDVSVPISGCQFLEHTKNFCRAIGTFGGPTRYGTYLLFLLGLSATRIFHAKKGNEKIFLGIFSALALANVFLTFSRSIWIGLIAMIIGALMFLPRLRLPPLPWVKIIVTLSSLVLIFIFFTYDSIQTIFLRMSSSSEHFQLMKEGFKILLQNPFGLGLGTVGPASLHFKKFITENWYLQIALETGIFGILLFLAALIQIFRSLLRKIRDTLEPQPLAFALFLSLLGISIAGLFTHSFEETTTVILLFGLFGNFFSQTRSAFFQKNGNF